MFALSELSLQNLMLSLLDPGRPEKLIQSMWWTLLEPISLFQRVRVIFLGMFYIPLFGKTKKKQFDFNI